MRLVFLVVLVFCLCIGLVQAVVIQPPARGPQEAIQYQNPGGGLADTTADNVWATATDIFVLLADGSIAATSDGEMRNATGSTGKMLRLNFYVESFFVGNYSLKFYADGATTYRFTAYLNSTNVNSSVSVSKTTGAAGWFTVDVTNLVTYSYPLFESLVVRATVTSTGTDRTIGEIYLIPPAAAALFQVMPQGVAEGDPGNKMENEWKILSQHYDFNVSNANCGVKNVNGTDVSSSVSMNVTTTKNAGQIGSAKLTVKWTANTSVVTPGNNYEVYCNLTLDNQYTITGIEQYVYMNQPQSFFQTIYDSVLKILGLLQKPTVVYVATPQIGAGNETTVVASVLTDGIAANVTGRGCRLEVRSQANLTGTVVGSGNMSSLGNGYYSYLFGSSEALAPYISRVTCEVSDASGTIVNYTGTRDIQPRSSAYTPTQIFEGTPSVDLFQTTIVAGSPGQILVQVKIGSNSVTNAVCNLTAYNSTLGKLVNNGQMSYSGDDGIYNYTWSPVALSGYAIYPTRVFCYGGSLGTMTVQDSSSMEVQDGVVMQMVT